MNYAKDLYTMTLTNYQFHHKKDGFKHNICQKKKKLSEKILNQWNAFYSNW